MKKWDLPKGWEWKKLGSVCEKAEYGYTTSASQKSTGPKFLRTTDISSGKINWGSVPYCSSHPNDEERYSIKNGDILISRAGSVGASMVITNPPRSVFASYLIRFRPKKGIDSYYLGYFLKSNYFFNQLVSESTGTTLKGVNATNLSRIELPVPSLETQKKIVAILDKAEEIKRLRAEANAQTQKMIQSVFLDMFGDPVKNPNQHAVIELGRIADIVSGITKGRKTTEPTSNVPYLRVANVQDGYLDLTEIKEIDATKSEICYYSLKDGDILLTEGGDPDKLGRGAVWHGQIPGCIHQNHVFRVRLTQADILSDYLSLLIGSNYGKMYFLKCAKQTTGIASINSSQLKKFPVLIPPIGDQQQFSESVQSIKNVAGHQKKSIDNIDSILSLLLSNVFRGRMTK